MGKLSDNSHEYNRLTDKENRGEREGERERERERGEFRLQMV